jgi:hypothetical protein
VRADALLANGTKRQQLAKHRPQSSMPAPKRQRTRNGGNELTLSTDLATECSTARASIASLYFTLSIGAGKGGRVSLASISTGASWWGMLGVIGTGTYPVRCASSCMDAYSHEVFAPQSCVATEPARLRHPAARPVPMYPHCARR